ncbi:MAG: TolC family protein [Gammaproteobacteria bacterium]|nr:TolC family protein [Gammaproteobacteria bacterium]
MTKIPRLSLLMITVFLTACVSYIPHPLKPDENLAILDARHIDDAALMTRLHEHYPQYNWPPAYWNLTQLNLMATEIHPEIAQAKAEFQLAQASLQSSQTLPNPQLNLTKQHTSNPPDGQGSWTTGVGLDFLLETAGKRDAKQRFAAQKLAVAQAGLINAQWQLRAHIRDALLALSEAKSTQFFLQKQISLVNSSVEAWNNRVMMGMSARSEQLAVEAHLTDLKQQLTTAIHDESDARHQLATALGLTPKAIEHLSLSLPVANIVLPSDGDSITATALQKRADIQASLAEYAASEAKLQFEVAKQYPDITLSPSYSWDAQSMIWSLGVGLALPLFNHNQSGIAEAEADRQVAKTRFEALQLNCRNAIEQAEKNEKTTALMELQAKEATQIAMNRLHAAENAFKAGATDRVQLLEIRETQIAMQHAQAQAEFNHARAVATLEDALQLPLNTFQDAVKP